MHQSTVDVLDGAALRLYRYWSLIHATSIDSSATFSPSHCHACVKPQASCLKDALCPVSRPLSWSPSCSKRSSPNRDTCQVRERSRSTALDPSPLPATIQQASKHTSASKQASTSTTSTSTHTPLAHNVQLWLLRRTASGRAAPVPAAVLRPATRRRQGLWRAWTAGIRHAAANAVRSPGRPCVHSLLVA